MDAIDTITPTGFFDFATIQPDSSPITIRSKRDMLLRRCGEATPRHCDRGEIATITMHDAAGIDRCDFEILTR